MWRRATKTLLWRTLAVLSTVLGLAGVFLPVLPSVPFLLLAAWAGGHGWPALEVWLLNHPRHGIHIRRWRENGAVPRRAKWAASAMMACSAVVVGLSPLPLWAKAAVPALMLVIAAWLWQRPEP